MEWDRLEKRMVMKQLLTILFFHLSITVSATTYYVSATGNDSNSGLTEVLPWQSIDKVNSFTGFVAGDNILFKRGDTFYGKIIVSNSGSSGNPITYGNYGFGDNPVITGFVTVGSWTDLGFNVWQSNEVSTLSNCNVVLINNINTAMGRTPNSGYWTYTSPTSTSITSDSLNASLFNWTGAQAVIKKERYVIDRATITSASGSTVSFVNPSSYNGHAGWGFFIQNDTRTLDQQNEWYYNGTDKQISVYSVDAPTNVKLATRDTLVYIVNKSYITFDGISFTGANGQAFYLGNASHLTIKNCSFDFNYNGIKGYQFGGSSTNMLIDSCTFDHTNNNAIELPSEFAGATITNNTISNTAIFEGLAASGQSRWGINVTGNNYPIKYNTVRNVGYVGIGFNGSSILVDKNRVDSFCLITDDGGGLYTGNVQTGMVISNNIVTNGIGNTDGTNSTTGAAYGIYCDDNSSGMSILNNSIADVINAGIFLHQAKDIIVRGNTTYNCRVGLFINADDNSKYTTGIEAKKNTFVAKTTGTMYTPQDQYCLWLASYHSDLPSFGVIDSNFYARPIDDNLTIVGTLYGVNDAKYSLPMWRTFSGYDLHTSRSPTSISNVGQLFFAFNPNNYDSTLNLGSNTYVDVSNTSYTGNVVLPSYSSLALISTGTLTTPTITWATPSAITYGTALSSTQLNATASVAGTFSYNYSSGTVLNAGTYTLTTIFTPTDGTQYSTATKSVTLTVNKATATLSYSGLIKTYNGLPQQPTVTTSPAGLSGVSTTYNGIGQSPTNAGTYIVISGLTNINYAATTITDTFKINKATATINAVNQEFNYDGLPHSISYTTYPVGLNITHTYSSGSAPTEIGVYTDTLRMVESNYEAGEIVRSITIVSNPAIIFISDTSKVYNGSAQGVTVTSDYTYAVTYDGSATIPTNAGSYEVIATINDGTHIGADTATLVIQKANPILTWTTPQPVQTGTKLTSSQLNATSNITGSFVYSSPLGTIVTEGILTITATFTPINNNYNSETISVSLNVYGNPFTNFIIGDYYQNK